MTMLIDKDDLISFLERVFPDNVIEGITSTTLFKQIIQDIRCQPIVMPEERPHGEWILSYPYENKDFVHRECSNCGDAMYIDAKEYFCIKRNFCPECGADMREVDND